LKPYYEKNGIVIYHGDCHEILSEIPAQSVDLLLTDPPFFMPAQHYASRSNWQRSWGDTSILARWWDGVIDQAIPAMRPTGHLLTFCDDESYPVFYPSLYRRFDTLASLVWNKGAIGMGSTWRHSHELIITARWSGSKWTGGASRGDVLTVSAIPSASRLHPVDKPVDLLGLLIVPTTDPGDTVLDPFMGGGSTLVAAKLNGRKAIGIELEERYCEIAAQRLSQEVFDFEVAA
jgi:DNA modification methylase